MARKLVEIKQNARNTPASHSQPAVPVTRSKAPKTVEEWLAVRGLTADEARKPKRARQKKKPVATTGQLSFFELASAA